MPVSSVIRLADLALTWSNASGDADLSMLDLDLASDAGLETAVILSLFTDRRAEDDDKPPSGDPNDRRGWWGDQFLPVTGDRFGSRLWLLDRSTRTTQNTLLAKEYARQALAWLLEDKVASAVDIVVEASGNALLIGVGIQRPSGDRVSYRFAHVWDAISGSAVVTSTGSGGSGGGGGGGGGGSSGDPMHIVIFGQSNARGQGDTNKADTGLLLTTAFAPVSINSKLGASNADPINYDIIQATTQLQPYQAGGLPNFGYELGLGRYVVGTNGVSTPLISKIAVNGQDIETMMPGAGTPTSPKEMYLQVTEYLDARVAAYGRPIDVVIFSQWEADATSQTKANNYATNLATLFTSLRARYGNFHLVLMKASTTQTGAGILPTPRDTIRATQVSYCGNPSNNAKLMDTEGIPLSNNLHFDHDGAVILGVRLGEYLANWKRPARLTDRAVGPTPWIQGNDMPCVGAFTANSTLTPWLPLHKAGDIIVVAVTQSVDSTGPTLTTANGFVQLGSTVLSGTNTTLSVYTKTASIGTSESGTQDPPPVITTSAGSEQAIAVAITIRGSSGVDGAPVTSSGTTSPTSQAGPTTTVPNTLVLFFTAANSGNQAQNITAWTDSNLTGFAEVRDTRRVINSQAQLLGIGAGTKETPGATGPAAATYATAPFWATMAIAFKP